MSAIIEFPIADRQQGSEIDIVIERELKNIPKKDQEKIRFELIKTIDSYDGFFSQWLLNVPQESSEAFKKQIYDIAHQEHERKMRMLKDIIELKVKNLVAAYRRGR